MHNGLQGHQQETKWEGDNCWDDYSEMEEIQNDHQQPITRGLDLTMQDPALWFKDDKQLGPQSPRKPFLTHYAIINDVLQSVQGSSAQEDTGYKPAFASEHLNDSAKAFVKVMWLDVLEVTWPAVFERREMLSVT